MTGENLVFQKTNYWLLITGFIVILIGFILMAINFNLPESEKAFTFSKITMSPALIVSGYVLLIFAIFKK